MRRHLWMGLAAVLALDGVLASAAGSVLVNGNSVPKAKSEVDIEKEVIEFREGGSNDIRLIPGRVTYRVCIESPGLVPTIEAACAPGAENPYLEVTIEDGRSFSRCLVESSKTFSRATAQGLTRITRYCLRCEGPN